MVGLPGSAADRADTSLNGSPTGSETVTRNPPLAIAESNFAALGDLQLAVVMLVLAVLATVDCPCRTI